MAIRFNTGPTAEEVFQQKKLTDRRRTRNIAITLVIAVVLRVVIKDPAPEKAADHGDVPIQYVPGMLDAIPASARAKLDPAVVAKMMAVDEQAKRKQTELAQAPAEEQVAMEVPKEALVEFAQLEKKRRRAAQRKQIEYVDTTKTILVLFSSGGALKAQKVLESAARVNVVVDRTLSATFPARMVRSVTNDALTWQEPIPKNYVRLRPARGITVTVHRETAKRITIRKNQDEI